MQQLFLGLFMGGGGKVARRMYVLTMKPILQKNSPIFVKKMQECADGGKRVTLGGHL